MELSSDSGGNNMKWIDWFCSLEGHEFLAVVPSHFIEEKESETLYLLNTVKLEKIINNRAQNASSNFYQAEKSPNDIFLSHDTINLQEKGESMFSKAKEMILGQGLEEVDLRDKEKIQIY